MHTFLRRDGFSLMLFLMALGLGSACKTTDLDSDAELLEASGARQGLSEKEISGTLEYLKRAGPEAEKAHPEAILDLPAGGQGIIQKDGQAALAQAALSTVPEHEHRAKIAADIILGWAEINKDFTNKNGFLASAWGVGAMARAGWILKKYHPREWARIQAKALPWMIATAEREWMPRKEPKGEVPKPKPQLLDRYESEDTSNRTFTALEATVHVARLADDRAWLSYAASLFEKYQPLWVDASGQNKDEKRGDPWHKQAGIAAAIQTIVILRQYDIDLSGAEDKAVLRTAEYYAERLQRDEIALYEAVVQVYGASAAPFSKKIAEKNHGYYYYKPEFSWGLPGLL